MSVSLKLYFQKQAAGQVWGQQRLPIHGLIHESSTYFFKMQNSKICVNESFSLYLHNILETKKLFHVRWLKI